MSNKVASLALTILLTLSTFIMLSTEDATAMANEQNLSGIIWLPDGSTPPSQTGFAIWVEYLPGSGDWVRFPDSGWYQTSAVVNSTLWYSFMLPDEWFDIRWGDGAIYRVEVDGIPWGGLATNATSNGTGSTGDPFPTPYDPTNLAHTYNTINYAAGGGTENEQQWDVRIMVFTDLIPTNVTVNGIRPQDYPGGIPVGGGDTVTIYVNATNIGLMPTQGQFDVASWECDASGAPFDIFNPIQEFLNLGPLNEYGNTTGNGYDTGVLSFSWMAPIQAGDYYINITADSAYDVLEINETNNTIILHFIVGPDIIPIDVTVDGVIYPNWPQISPIILPAPGQWINISINLTNIGASGTGPIPFNVSFYNVSVSGAHLPTDPPFYESGDVFSNLDVGQIFSGGWARWYAPAPGEFRINLTVDFGGTVSELNESNNTYVLRVLVGPDVLPTNVTVEGILQTQSPSAAIAVGSGQIVAIGVNATNDGFSPTGRDIWVGFFNSTQSGSMLNQPYYNTSVPELAAAVDPGNTMFVTGGYWIAPNAPGTYYVTIYIDIGNDTHEYNEANNSFTLCFTIGPDLTYANVTVNGILADLLDPTEVWYVGSGETISIGLNAKNAGASPTALTFSISITNCTLSGDPIDTPFDTFNWPFGLGIGESTAEFIASWVVPNFVGSLYVNITVDYLDDVSESVEINNTYILHFMVGPDYIPNKVWVDGQEAQNEAMVWNVTPQAPVNIGVNCSNIGVSDVNSSNTYTISFYNSTIARDMVEEFDTIISLFGLPAGGDSGEQVGVWIPPNEPGDYYVLVVVDSENDTWEFNENNNTFLLHFVIGPDLVPSNVSVNGNPAVGPSQIWYVGLGEQVIIGANATNIGFSGTGVPFDMSLVNVSMAGSVIIGDSNPQDIVIPALGAGEDSGHMTWIWYVPLIAGEYYVNITVDYYNVSWESDEFNNNFTLHFIVAPDLTPTNISVDGSPISSYPSQTVTVYPGQIITIGANTSNVGLSGTGILQFNMTFWNSTQTGQIIGMFLYDTGLLGPLLAGGATSDYYVNWIAPSPGKPTDYYINITVDSTQVVSEWVETNNTYILHIKVDAPDLTPDRIEVEVAGSQIAVYDEPSTLPIPFVSEEIFIPVGEDLNIFFTIANIGGIDQLTGTNVTAYNISDVGGSPIDDPFYESGPNAVFLVSGDSVMLVIIWPNPGAQGIYYFNVSIDYNGILDIGGRIIELNERNNTFSFVINVTSIPITTLRAGTPRYQPGLYWYVNSSTELNFTVIGPNPPFYTWYRIINLTNGSEAKGWTNYTAEGMNFTMVWGEGTFWIEYNSTDFLGGAETTKYRIIIVDDSPPLTNIIVGIPQYRIQPSDILNVTDATPFDLSAVDLPLGTSSAGPGIMNASGLGGIGASGLFYRIQNLSADINVTEWLEYSPGISFYLDDPAWGDGYYRIWFNSTDNLGQMESLKFIDVYLDKTGPTTTIVVGNPKYPHAVFNWYVKSTTPFSLTAYEIMGSGANESTIRFRITNLDTGNTSGWLVGTSLTISGDYPFWASEGEENYTIEFSCRDHLDNWGSMGSITIFVDDTPPITTLLIGDPKYRDNVLHIWNITSQTPLDFLVDDGIGCGVNYTEYRIYNSSFTSLWYTYPMSSINLSFLPLYDGIYTMEYRSYDYLSNNLTANQSFYLDNTPPITVISDPPIGPTYRDLSNHIWNISYFTSFELTFDDTPGSGVDFTMYRVRNSTYTSSWFSYLAQFNLPLGLSDGIYNIEYYSADNLGNPELEKQYTIYLDNTPPTTNITVGDPKFRINISDVWNVTSSSLFALASTDIGSGVETILYQIDSDTPRIYNGSYFVLAGADGEHTIRYWARDNVFNTESQHEIHVILDNSPPQTDIIFGEPRYWANESADILNITRNTPINITSIDGGIIPVGIDFIEYMVDDDFDLGNGNVTGWVTVTGLFDLAGLDDGDYVIYYHAVDLLGNVEAILNITIIVDNTRPVSQLDVAGVNHTKPTDPDTWWVRSSTDITITSIDFGSPPVGLNFTEYRISTNGGVWGNWQNFSGGYTELSLGADGEYGIEFRGVDYLDNTEPSRIVTIIVDDLPPETDISITGLFQQIGSTIWYEADFNTVFTLGSTDLGGWQTPSGVDTLWLRLDSNDDADWILYTGSFSFDTMGNHTIDYRAIDNLTNEEIYSRLRIYIEGDISPPKPPVLKLRVDDDDILLYWEPSTLEDSQDVHHYLIYKSTTKTGFDFSFPWVDTSGDLANGVDPVDGNEAPLRTTWNHTQAVSEETEYYYVIRGVDGRNNIGYPSNIAGMVTLTFHEGYNTFSLPLEPFETVSASQILENNAFTHDTDTIYRYDADFQRWMAHPKFFPVSITDFELEFGEGYMIFISEDNIKYSFTGAAATSIRFTQGVGNEPGFAKSLTAEVSASSVLLNWNQTENATGYRIFRAEERIASGSLTDFTMDHVYEAQSDETTWTDNQASKDEYYYLVVALDSVGMEKSSTYALGVKRFDLSEGYNIISYELEPRPSRDTAFFTDTWFSTDENALFYYDRVAGCWVGRTRFLPSNMNNMQMDVGQAYMIYADEDQVNFNIIGI